MPVTPVPQPISVKPVTATGTSSSGTPATTIAELTAAAGKAFVGWSIFYEQVAGGAASHAKLIATFTDDTTVDLSITTISSQWIVDPKGAFCLTSLLTATLWSGAVTALGIKKLRVETLGAGTGARIAHISAWVSTA